MGKKIHEGIKCIYGEIKGYSEALPKKEDGYCIASDIVNDYNESIKRLSEISKTDYDKHKVFRDVGDSPDDYYDISIVRAKMFAVVNRLKAEYNFSDKEKTSSPGIVIFNENRNEMTLHIDYTINNLIDEEQDEEAKKKLGKLKTELSSSNKSWNTIKNILTWILNYSKDLSLKVIPLILKSKI